MINEKCKKYLTFFANKNLLLIKSKRHSYSLSKLVCIDFKKAIFRLFYVYLLNYYIV